MQTALLWVSSRGGTGLSLTLHKRVSELPSHSLFLKWCPSNHGLGGFLCGQRILLLLPFSQTTSPLWKVGRTLSSESKDLNSHSGAMVSYLCDLQQLMSLGIFSALKRRGRSQGVSGISCNCWQSPLSPRSLDWVWKMDHPVGELLLVWNILGYVERW